jgi:hypothetical protein
MRRHPEVQPTCLTPDDVIAQIGASRCIDLAAALQFLAKSCRTCAFLSLFELTHLRVINLHGNVLSIYESSDVAGTCDSYFHDATGLQDHEEIALHTGLAHGFIYRPLREWVEPTTRWAESAHSGR